VAVRNLTLDVSRGEVFGFLGPNGAGKSTSVKMLLGLVFPTSGGAEILGCPVGDVKARSKVGFLPEHFRFYDWLTSTELLKLHGRLYGMSHATLRERVPALLDLVGLTPHRDKRLHDFSKGMLQRIDLKLAPPQPALFRTSACQVMWRLSVLKGPSLRVSRGERHINLCAT
jgi:ABC-2 type transport system ATP-binding protein